MEDKLEWVAAQSQFQSSKEYFACRKGRKMAYPQGGVCADRLIFRLCRTTSQDSAWQKWPRFLLLLGTKSRGYYSRGGYYSGGYYRCLLHLLPPLHWDGRRREGIPRSFCHVGQGGGGTEVGGQLSVGLWRCTCNQWWSLHCVVFQVKDILQHSYLKEYIKQGLYCNN